MATCLENLYNKWEKEIQEISLFISDNGAEWLNKHPDVMTIWNNAHQLRVASALVSGSTVKYRQYSASLLPDLKEANHFIQKAACSLLHKSLKHYRKVRTEWDTFNGQQPPKN